MSNRGAVYCDGATTVGSNVSTNRKLNVSWNTNPLRSKPRFEPPGAAISIYGPALEKNERAREGSTAATDIAPLIRDAISASTLVGFKPDGATKSSYSFPPGATTDAPLPTA